MLNSSNGRVFAPDFGERDASARQVRTPALHERIAAHPSIHAHGMFFRLLARNGTEVDEPFFNVVDPARS